MMARGLPYYYLAFLCGLFLVCSPSVGATQIVGTVTKVQNQAQVGSTAAASGTPVAMNDEVRTGPGARLEVTFRDDTSLTLGENARVVIDRFVYNPGASTGALTLNATKGAFRFTTGKLGAMTNKDVSVRTPYAALAVRGTEFWWGFVPGYDQFGVLLLSKMGRVNVSNSAGGVTLASQGEGTDVPPQGAGQLPSNPVVWTAEKMAAALATTQFGSALLTPERVMRHSSGRSSGEKISSTARSNARFEEPHQLQVLEATAAAMRRGDTLIVPSLATLKQPTENLIEFVLDLVSKGLRVRALQEKFDTNGTASVVAALQLLSQLKQNNSGDGKR